MKKTTHRHGTVGCRKVFRFICENLDASLDSPRCREIRHHIAGCRSCTAYLDSLKKTVALYRAYPVPVVSPELSQSILASLPRLPRRKRGR